MVGGHAKQKKDFPGIWITRSCFLFSLFSFGVSLVEKELGLDEKEDSLHDIFVVPQCNCAGNNI